MNNLLLIGLLVVPSIYCGQNYETPRQICFVDNQVDRMIAAAKEGIANMNNLKYLESLEPAIYKVLSKTGGCTIPADVTVGNYRISNSSIRPDYFKKSPMLQAGSTVMACVKSICMKDGEPVYTFIADIPVDGPILVENDPVGNGRRGYVRKGINIEIPTDQFDVKWKLPKIPNFG